MSSTATPTVWPKSGNELVDSLMKTAFDRPRDPRSYPYKLGAFSLLASRATDTPLARPYAPGTVDFDAFHAGVDEGKAIWACHNAEAAQ
ncbi:hypothetical protein [Massilia timonae]|uniref:hypothetical protein n=1 Tax=Massilia timonae TaxID=47229 RepID=UPI0028A0329A|nr:hypothetical protein [Massilia timonae]